MPKCEISFFNSRLASLACFSGLNIFGRLDNVIWSLLRKKSVFVFLVRQYDLADSRFYIDPLSHMFFVINHSAIRPFVSFFFRVFLFILDFVKLTFWIGKTDIMDLVKLTFWIL